ncbi:MAG: phospholipase D-like domain-containing protein [Bacteroidota bacterium]
MKFFFTTAVLLLTILKCSAQVISIDSARTLSTATAVTVRGIASNGSEFGGSTRYIQDGTAGICLYGSTLSSVNIGDSIEASGTIAPYNNLMEIAVTSFSIITTGNNPHPPVTLALLAGFDEIYEGQLVRINTIAFSGTGSFAGSTNYDITDGTSIGQVRINSGSNIVSTPIPAGNFDIVGIMSQYQTTYQLLPRDLNDFITIGNPPVFTTSLTQTNISTTGFTVSFQTQNQGNTIVRYGLTNALGSEVMDAIQTTNHSVNLSGLTPGTLYYVKGVTIAASGDTSFSSVQVMGTQSLSTQTITCYFNHPTDSSFASSASNYAHYLNQVSADTLIAYINRAQHTIDVAIYNMDDANGIVTALNLAASQGVTVRVVADNGINSAAYNSLIGSIQKIMSPSGANYGIMHNKFVVIDANSSNPNEPIVWTGSMNFTDDQVNIDAQNIIVFQDQTMARSYTLEFEEMLGGTFGPDKSDNTAHEFNLNGTRVEQCFSPSDNTNVYVKNALLTANTSIHFLIFSFTRTEIAYPITDNYQSFPGYFAQGMMNDTSGSSAVWNTLIGNMTATNLKICSASWLLHHKYAIVDEGNVTSDPQVVTGSYNWSNSATFKNDENEVIVHNSSIANQYLQEFAKRFEEEGGVVMVGINDVNNTSHFEFTAFPNPVSDNLEIRFYSEKNANTIIELIDVTGKIVLGNSFENSSGNQHFNVNTSLLASGIYLLKVSSGSFSSAKKILVR